MALRGSRSRRDIARHGRPTPVPPGRNLDRSTSSEGPPATPVSGFVHANSQGCSKIVISIFEISIENFGDRAKAKIKTNRSFCREQRENRSEINFHGIFFVFACGCPLPLPLASISSSIPPPTPTLSTSHPYPLHLPPPILQNITVHQWMCLVWK